MGRFRKLPVEVEAIRYGGEWTPVFNWLTYFVGLGPAFSIWQNDDRTLSIETLEGTMRADVGDYVIRGVQGEFYPCKPGIFEATYEPVEEG